MNDEELIGYLLDALDDDDERAAVESHIRQNRDAAVRLEELRLAFVPLEADREPGPAPVGLALRTVARLAAHLAEHEPSRGEPAGAAAIVAVAHSLLTEETAAEVEAEAKAEAAPSPLAFPAPAPSPRLPRAPRDEPELTAVGGRFRPELFVAGGIALFAVGLLVSAVSKVRTENQMLACQNTLRTIHTGLGGYADTHHGRYPQVGIGANPTAETFATVLSESGQVPANFRPCCPAAFTASPTPVGYTYTLGYRAPDGDLLGLRRPEGAAEEHDLIPIVADFPTAEASPGAGPTCPHGSVMNVLDAGGQVLRTRSALIGPGGDDIFRNVYGQVAAGADRCDVVLGRPGDRP